MTDFCYYFPENKEHANNQLWRVWSQGQIRKDVQVLPHSALGCLTVELLSQEDT